jgi:hypothetical protein
MDLNEARTRALLINPQLERSGWNLSDHSQVQFEIPVTGYDPTRLADLPAEWSPQYHVLGLPAQ